MKSPWEILGLEAETADKKTVKRAYAGLLKKHRPDVDPEGFQEINQAYTFALQYLEHPEWFDDPAQNVVVEEEVVQGEPKIGEEDVPISFVKPAPPKEPVSKADWPESFLMAKEALMERGREGDPEALVAAGQAFCLQFAEAPRLVDEWGATMLDVFDGRPEAFIDALSGSDLIRELELDRNAVTLQVLRCLEELDRYVEIQTFGKKFLKAKDRLETSSAGYAAYQMARQLCVYKHLVARDLMNVAFTLVSAADRNYLFGTLEYNLSIGMDVKGIRPKLKITLSRILNGQDELDLTNEEHRVLLYVLRMDVAPGGAAYHFFRELNPTVVKDWEGRQAPVHQNRQLQISAGRSGFSWWWIFVIFMIIKFILIAARNSSNSNNRSYNPPAEHWRNYNNNPQPRPSHLQ